MLYRLSWVRPRVHLLLIRKWKQRAFSGWHPD
nr:MAG TPA: hypothetical protein [Herelleviridae sp.]